MLAMDILYQCGLRHISVFGQAQFYFYDQGMASNTPSSRNHSHVIVSPVNFNHTLEVQGGIREKDVLKIADTIKPKKVMQHFLGN